jgi:DeoR/GlpR family transcriptional regulator of sugar metabolism
MPVSEVHHVITDKDLPESIAEALRIKNIEVTLV